MALSPEDIRAAAERLDRAEKTRTQIRQLSQEFPAITLDDAYAIQKQWIEIKTSAGRVVKGHKIGLTSKAMQSALNIDEPDSGVLLDDMFFVDGGFVPSDRFIATRVEAELAFVMKHRLAGPGCTMFDVLNATDFVVPALEILDTRIERVDTATKSTRKIFEPSPTTRPMPASCSAAARYGRATPTCAGSARCAIATASWRRPGLPPACSITPLPPWPGSRTRSRPMASRWRRVRWYWRARSFARSRPAKATRSRPTMAGMEQ
jgi:2-oxo-hept-3-ene-1,7-dioate hydratase